MVGCHEKWIAVKKGEQSSWKEAKLKNEKKNASEIKG